jgi:membrane associated rhomboid family serine protease
MGNISLLVLSLPLLFSLYPKSKYIVLSLGTIIPSIFCYLIGKDIIGISGLVFTVIWFLILSGLQNQDNLKFLVAVLLSAFLGNTLISITPSAGFNIAWESHLVGFLVGFVLSLFEKSK